MPEDLTAPLPPPIPMGIENLKKGIKFGIDFAQQAITSGKDGWQWTDTFSFIDEMSALPGVIKSGPQVLLELKDLSDAERDELNLYVKEEFDIADDKAEKVIEASLAIAFSVVSLISMLS